MPLFDPKSIIRPFRHRAFALYSLGNGFSVTQNPTGSNGGNGGNGGAGGFGGGSAAGAVAVADMSRYCAGEASAKFKVSPRDIKTENAKQTKGIYEIWGQYPAQPSPQVFICSFNAERQFLSVDLYRP